jgi:peptidoglycan-N-acetylglucosamine deacetylase
MTGTAATKRPSATTRTRRALATGALALVLLIVAVGYAAWWPTCEWFGPVVTHFARTPTHGAPRIALTFDDGPDPEVTPRILETLAAHGAKATFFFCGARAEKHPAIVAAAFAAGHSVANHTYSHPALPLLSRSEIESEVRRTDEILRAALSPAGAPAPFFRPPFGLRDLSVHAAAERFGFQTVLWSDSPRDWQAPAPEEITARVLSAARDGAIVLLHDGDARANSGRANTAAALPAILAGLHSRGFRCVTLDAALGDP